MRQTELLAGDLGDFGHEIEGVDGGLVGVVEEPGDVEEAAFVAEVGFLAVEDEVPDAEALSKCIFWSAECRVGNAGRPLIFDWGMAAD